VKVNRIALIAFRRTGGDTRGSLAKRAGITEEALRLIENGETQRPRPGTIRALADALSVPVGAITTPDTRAAS
jgi:transcriptional regulator with XRE-family HTH domain